MKTIEVPPKPYRPTPDDIQELKEAVGSPLRQHHTPMTLNEYASACHKAAIKWWQNPVTGEPISRNKGELIALIHSELSEMLEGVRKGLPDDKLPQYPMEWVECVDTLIRLFDYAGAFKIPLDEIFRAKMAFNAVREDHQHESRTQPGGKRF